MRTFAAFAAVAGLALADNTATLLTGPPMGVYKTANAAAAITATTLAEATLTTAGLHKRDLSTPTGPPMGVYKTAARETPLTAETLAVAPTAAKAGLKKRGTLVARDEICVAQPAGINYVTSPDDPNSFTSDPYYSNAANNAALPAGYTQVFKNIVAANSADNYMGFTFLDSYDVAKCGASCTKVSGCASFNIYFERDPVMAPDKNNCPNPPSLTRVKCVWWGGLVSLDNANNYGNMQANFYVVVAGSNGYENTERAAALRAATPTVAGATVATETATSKSVWIVYYSADSSQGAFSNAQASASYTDCMAACDNTATCKAFTYVGGDGGKGSGTCWLKTALGNPNSSGKNVITAVRVVDKGGPVASSSTTTTVAPTTQAPTSAAPTSAAPTSAAPVVNVVSSSSSTTLSTSSTTTVSLYRPDYGSSKTTAPTIEIATYSAPPTTSPGTDLPVTTPAASSSTTSSTTVSTSSVPSPASRYTSDMNCGQMAGVSNTFSDGTNAYIIRCSHDIPSGNGDIGSAPSTSYYNCFSACAGYNGCQAFTFYNGVCYFKSLNNVKVAPDYSDNHDFAYIARYYTNTVAAVSSTTSAAPTTTPAATTPAPVTTTSAAPALATISPAKSCSALSGNSITSNGQTYSFKCGYDLVGYGDVGNTEKSGKTYSFTDCFAACDGFAKCNAFALNGGNCYFKSLSASITTSPSPLSWVDFAFVSSAYPAGASIITPVTATTSTAAAATTPATPATSSCAQLSGTSFTSGGKQYNFKCGYDLVGPGDIGSTYGQPAMSFTECFALCNTRSDCNAIVLNSGTCYLKGLSAAITQVPAARSGCDFAWLPGSYPAGNSVFGGSFTAISASSASITPAPTTTFATAVIKQVATTTSTAAATPSQFYIQVGGSQSASNQYLVINWLAGARVTYTYNKSAATLFRIDSSGYLRNINGLSLLSNYLALTDSSSASWQRVGFRPGSLVFNADPVKCWLQDGFVQCNDSTGFVYAGTCNNDGYLYFGAPSQITRSCAWTGLYPVPA